MALRRAGIDSINLDLMYGLPHQTPESCEESAELVMELTPARLSVFGYAHVPWMKKHQRLIDEIRTRRLHAAGGSSSTSSRPCWPTTAIIRSAWITSPWRPIRSPSRSGTAP